MSFSFDDFTSGIQDSINRRIDNELNSDYLPSPAGATNEAPVIRTGINDLGAAKTAGTGQTGAVSTNWFGGVPNSVVIGASVVILGIGAIAALR